MNELIPLLKRATSVTHSGPDQTVKLNFNNKDDAWKAFCALTRPNITSAPLREHESSTEI